MLFSELKLKNYMFSKSSITHLRVDTVGVPDLAINLLDASAHGARAVQVPHCVQAHVAEPLREKSATFSNSFLYTVPTFAVRETDVSRHNGGTSFG